MKTPIFFVSDNHFQKRNDDSERGRRKKFYSLLNHIKDNQGTLIIGGDFFDFWFEYKGYVPFEYLDIFEKLKELKSSGVEIYYILGNHDYWDFGFFNRTFATESFKNQFCFKHDNKKIVIMHGDGVLKEDRGYRLFRRIIRSKLCIFLYNLLSPRIGYYIANKISHADKPKEYYKHNEIIKKKLTKYAEKKWNEVDVLLLGHYHQSGIITKNNKKLIFLGDWLNQFLVTKYDNGSWEQINWD